MQAPQTPGKINATTKRAQKVTICQKKTFKNVTIHAFFCESCLCKTFEKIHVYSEGSQSSFSFEGHIIQVLLTTQK